MQTTTPRKPLWLDLQPVDIKSRWRHNWKSAQVVNSHLVWDPTIRQLGFDLPRQQLSLLNRFRTEQGGTLRCLQKEMATYRLCPCGETQMMFHIVKSCPLTKLNGGWSRLHSVDEDTVPWLTSYGSWHVYEKKNADNNCLVPEVWETKTRYTTFVVLKFLTSIPNLPSQASHYTSNTRVKNEEQEPTFPLCLSNSGFDEPIG